MSLAETLAQLNKQSCESLAAPEMAILQRAIMMLRRSGIVEQSIQVGETVPNFEIPSMGDDNGTEDENGKSPASNLYQLLDQRDGVVLNFFRGFWCSFCQAQLSAFESALNDLQASNIEYIAISPQPPESQGDCPLEYCIVHDQSNNIARDFGIVYELDAKQRGLFTSWNHDLAKLHCCEKWELPLPATYLIGKDRRIKFCNVDPDFRKRIDPRELLDFARQDLA